MCQRSGARNWRLPSTVAEGLVAAHSLSLPYAPRSAARCGRSAGPTDHVRAGSPDQAPAAPQHGVQLPGALGDASGVGQDQSALDHCDASAEIARLGLDQLLQGIPLLVFPVSAGLSAAGWSALGCNVLPGRKSLVWTQARVYTRMPSEDKGSRAAGRGATQHLRESSNSGTMLTSRVRGQ
jgi:hypothetical protein